MTHRLAFPVLLFVALLIPGAPTYGDVIFGEPVEIGTCGFVLGSELIDMNGDGDLDLLTIRGGSVVRRIGDGQGGFGSPRAFAAVPGLEGFATADFNDDGLVDVVAKNAITRGKAAILLGTSGDTFGPAQLVDVPDDAEGWTALVGDFNGDGAQDFITLSYGLDARFFAGDGSGTFGESDAVTALAGRPVVADFDEDGKTELALIDEVRGPLTRSNISILELDENEMFVQEKAFLIGRRPTELRAADFDGNGRIDLLVLDLDRAIYLLPGRGAAGFKQVIASEPISMSLQIAAIADLDGDADLDVLFGVADLQGNPSYFAHVLEADGRFRRGTYESVLPETVDFEFSDSITTVAAGPLNGDDRADLVFTSAIPRKLIAAYGE